MKLTDAMAYNVRQMVIGATVHVDHAIVNHLPRQIIEARMWNLLEARDAAHKISYQLALDEDELEIEIPLEISDL